MSTRNRTPAALKPYLRLPSETSLILLTSTLSCTVNWLTPRFIIAAINGSGHGDHTDTQSVPGAREEGSTVILTSWMRNQAYWKTELRRITAGMDMDKVIATGKLAFVDCFTNLTQLAPEKALSEQESRITQAIAKANGAGRRIVLVLENPDILIALALTTTYDLSDFLLRLRNQVHSTVLVCNADLPLVAAATTSQEGMQNTPIEAETAAFLVQQAHAAQYVLGVRELETGAAKDVSGVLRVTRGGAAYSWDDEEDDVEEVKELEALYLIQRDGNAKVFERGTSMI
ncbi:hypothetical protein LTR78_005762 [Recurvomyces mirabilis]|uniref:Elongator complex protein 6 n=1 Tax=Recurvomyces mirabilis TaxID=574656 RepID=A0AAE0WM94_9PEZI|nr:hypothetical protein LTR78_005762 [Recurvomyces mirabilis]KAK5154141.1 hypothetical protein LTS14_006826 [Recurvomyces mirabilis]